MSNECTVSARWSENIYLNDCSKEIPENARGIYIIYNNLYTIYVGQGNIFNQINSHRNNSHKNNSEIQKYHSDKNPLKFIWSEFNDRDLNSVEYFCYRHYNPLVGICMTNALMLIPISFPDVPVNNEFVNEQS